MMHCGPAPEPKGTVLALAPEDSDVSTPVVGSMKKAVTELVALVGTRLGPMFARYRNFCWWSTTMGPGLATVPVLATLPVTSDWSPPLVPMVYGRINPEGLTLCPA